jgi:3-hydroxybutyryl-CoA dehydrogenase
MADIKQVGVLGAGLMGHGIAQVAAQAGYEVVLREVDEATLAKGLGKIEKQLARSVEKGKATQEEADSVRARIHGTVDYRDLAPCDLVLEAITENLALHYFNPAQVMKLVEVVRCVTTTDAAFETALAFARSEGKLAIPTRDRAGFIVNRLLVPYMLDAIRAYEEGVGSVSEIDEAMKAGAGHPMGPLVLSDFVGLDTLGSICDVLFEEFRERRFAQPPTLRKMLSAGWYGRKSGMGFYDYSGGDPVANPGI